MFIEIHNFFYKHVYADKKYYSFVLTYTYDKNTIDTEYKRVPTKHGVLTKLIFDLG